MRPQKEHTNTRKNNPLKKTKELLLVFFLGFVFDFKQKKTMSKRKIELAPEDASFLGTQSQVYAKTLVRAINQAFSVYTLPRFAPVDRDEKKDRVLAIARLYDIEPTVVSRPIAIYCGNNVLPAVANVGSNFYCLRRGHNATNKAAG